jgi:hypothetical protein
MKFNAGLIRALVVVGLAGPAWGCSSYKLPPDEFVAQFAAPYCALLLRCCGAADAGNLFDYGMSVESLEQCESVTRTELAIYASTQNPWGISLVYDPAEAASCLAGLETHTCERLVQSHTRKVVPLAGCERVFTFPRSGTSRAGTVCGSDYDCAPGLACDQPAYDPAHDEALGVCKPIAEVPGACPLCPAGNYCEIANGMASCVSKRPDGAPCEQLVQCHTAICWKEPLAKTGVCGLPAGMCRLEP